MLAQRDWGDKSEFGDGTEVFSRARVFEGAKPLNTRAVTPEAAESTANANFAAIWRRAMPPDAKLSFATVEGVQGTNEDRAKKTVMPRARSAIDVPTGPRPDMISGNAQVPLVAMGGAALAQTYEGEAAMMVTLPEAVMSCDVPQSWCLVHVHRTFDCTVQCS